MWSITGNETRIAVLRVKDFWCQRRWVLGLDAWHEWADMYLADLISKH